MATEQKQPADALGSSEGLGPESERAAFEAHMDGLQYNLRRHAERPHQYANTAVQGRWVSWQAAVAAERERCDTLVNALRRIAKQDPVELMLDPQWAARVARITLTEVGLEA